MQQYRLRVNVVGIQSAKVEASHQCGIFSIYAAFLEKPEVDVFAIIKSDYDIIRKLSRERPLPLLPFRNKHCVQSFGDSVRNTHAVRCSTVKSGCC